MKKSNLFLLFAIFCLAGKITAQTTPTIIPCYSTEKYQQYVLAHPEIAQYQKQLEEQTIQYYKTHPAQLNRFARMSSTSDTVYYDIPVVVHVMHDYGVELSYLTDDFIYNMMATMNIVYAGLNADLSEVIPPFQKYIGSSVIRFHLASVDPNGNPTNGITHHRTYLTYGGDDMAKMDQWPPASYYNIWFENVIGAGSAPGSIILAYSNFPAAAASYPFNDGVISRYNADQYSDYTIEHETGHYFNLLHPWNNNGAGNGVCGGPNASGTMRIYCGDDDVDDTPPTYGHPSTCPLYDTGCAENYWVIYTDAAGNDSLVNYPDTTNTQNIMDYSSCTDMFTKGQIQRMYASLNSNVGNRNNLYDTANLIATGVWTSSYTLVPKLDLKPIPDFSASNPTAGLTSYMDLMDYFTFPGTEIKFTNHSWNDTVTGVSWKFSNGASVATSTSMNSFINTFTQPGWVSISLTATGNNTGDSTITWPNAVFVANTTATNGVGYYQEFNPDGDRTQWPTFNYYNNSFRWQLNDNIGFDDSHSIEYLGYDSSLIIDPVTGTYIFPHNGTPGGDFDDLFTTPMDLSGFTDTCNLNFYYSGASRSSSITDVNDSMQIAYSVAGSNTWTVLATLTQATLDNMGASATPFAPASANDWAPMGVGLPAAARKSYVVFRFRYMPKNGTSLEIGGFTENYPMSSGNNYYMDRINFSTLPAGIDNVKLNTIDVAVVPNPTSGDAYVIITDAFNAKAQITVTDITGKVVYTTSQIVTGGEAHILIPHDAIAVSGMYLVQATTGSQTQTKKLIVY